MVLMSLAVWVRLNQTVVINGHSLVLGVFADYV